jgi:hypothetical protein
MKRKPRRPSKYWAAKADEALKEGSLGVAESAKVMERLRRKNTDVPKALRILKRAGATNPPIAGDGI